MLSSWTSFWVCFLSVVLPERTLVRADWAWATSSWRPAEDWSEDWVRRVWVSPRRRETSLISNSELAWYEGERKMPATFSRPFLTG